jgi:hypothetical protein
MQSVTAVAKETVFYFGPYTFYNCGNAGITSGQAVNSMVTLPEHLLVDIKISMSIVHLNDGEAGSVL